MRNFFKNINKFAIIALLLTSSAVFAAKHHAATKTFGRQVDPVTHVVTWVDVTGELPTEDYLCSGSSNICTAQFDNDDPATGNIIPSSEQPGNFQQ